jgi:hypothetical protein
LATFRDRFASGREVSLLFAACVFPIHVWSILRLLSEVPAWMLRMTAWDLVGAIAYTQTFALIESVLILLGVVFLAAILPARIFRDRLVAQGSVVVFLSSLWAVAVHLGGDRLWDSGREFLTWSMLYLASIGLSSILIHRQPRLQRWVNSAVERLIPLSVIYVCIDVLSITIVAVRNVLGTVT